MCFFAARGKNKLKLPSISNWKLYFRSQIFFSSTAPPLFPLPGHSPISLPLVSLLFLSVSLIFCLQTLYIWLCQKQCLLSQTLFTTTVAVQECWCLRQEVCLCLVRIVIPPFIFALTFCGSGGGAWRLWASARGGKQLGCQHWTSSQHCCEALQDWIPKPYVSQVLCRPPHLEPCKRDRVIMFWQELLHICLSPQ